MTNGIVGIGQGSGEWLYAMRSYYANDGDVVYLCGMVTELQAKIKELEEQGEQQDGQGSNDNDRTGDVETSSGAGAYGLKTELL